MLASSKYPEISIEALGGYTEDADSGRAFIRSYYWIIRIVAIVLAAIILCTVFGYFSPDIYWGLAVVSCLVAIFVGLVRAYRATPLSCISGRPMKPYRNSSAPEGVFEIIYIDSDSRTYFRHIFAVPPTGD